MLNWNLMNGADSQAGAFLTGEKGYQLLWCPTARDRTTSDQGRLGDDASSSEAARQNETVYMVGLKERIEAFANNGKAWQWRRICFTLKGASINSSETPPFYENSDGFVRVIRDYNGTDDGSAITDIVFRGTQNIDWSNVMTAPTDNRRCTIKYDKTIVIGSGNESGRVHNYRRWHPMKSSLVYDDDEAGGSTNANYFSVSGKQGMGDFYIMDIITCPGGTSGDNLSWNPEAILYWHER